MMSGFAGVGHLAAPVRIALGPGESQERINRIAEQLWDRGVRSMDELCIDDEFFEMAERRDRSDRPH